MGQVLAKHLDKIGMLFVVIDNQPPQVAIANTNFRPIFFCFRCRQLQIIQTISFKLQAFNLPTSADKLSLT